MHLSAFVALAILACANALTNSAPESPMDAVSHTVNLYNGVSTNPTIVGHPDTPVVPMGPRNMCSGSALCSNRQKFRDKCYEAYTKLQDIVYTTNGNGAGGVCAGTCGFFLEGRGCTATMVEFVEAYQTIRHTSNCQTCGFAYKPNTNGRCWIKFDYVSKCH